MGDEIDSTDRISDLPSFIIHQIMSSLSVEEIARTSILSKKWYNFWRSFPNLDFDQAYFVGPVHEKDPMTGLEIERDEGFYNRFLVRMVGFVNFVHHSVLKFCELKFRMYKFRILITLVSFKALPSLLDQWILLAVENGVEDLDFSILIDRNGPYNMPQTIFSAKSVTTLKLGGCKLEQPADTVGFCLLKTLTLDNVHLDEQIIQKVTSGCPLLEELYFNSCSGMKRFCITEPRRLKTLHITVSLAIDIESVRIAVPNLQLFRLEFEPRLRSPCMIDLAGCPHLIDLELNGDILNESEFHYLISTLPLLEMLTVEWCGLLERVVISSNRLRNLWIANCANLQAIDVDTPYLHFFSYVINPIPISSRRAPCPWSVVLTYSGEDPHWYHNLKEFLSATTQICELTIFVDSARNAFHLEDFPERSSSVLLQVEQFLMHTRTLPSNLADLLDGIFLVCYPKRLCLDTGKFYRKKIIKFLLNELKNKDVNCCEADDIKCWRHYLNGFVLECPMVQDGNELMDIDSFAEVLSTNPLEKLQFRLDWSLPPVDDSLAVDN